MSPHHGCSHITSNPCQEFYHGQSLMAGQPKKVNLHRDWEPLRNINEH